MIDIQLYFQILFWNWKNIRNFLITRDRGNNKLPTLQILHLFTCSLEFFKTQVFLCLCICDYSLGNFDLDDAGDLRVCVSPALTQVTQGMKELRCCQVRILASKETAVEESWSSVEEALAWWPPLNSHLASSVKVTSSFSPRSSAYVGLNVCYPCQTNDGRQTDFF